MAEIAGSGDSVASSGQCIECGHTFLTTQMVKLRGATVCANCKPIHLQKLKEGGTIAGKLEYATVGKRFLAILIDGLLLWVVNTLMSMVVMAGLARDEQSPEAILGVTSFLVLIQLAIGLSYEVWFIGAKGATLGKMAMNIKVVSPSGQPISFGRSLGRYFAKMLSSLIFLIGFVIAFSDEEKRTLHDRICDTRVVCA